MSMIRTTIIATTAALALGSTLADDKVETSTTGSKKSAEVEIATRREMVLERTGGIVEKAGDGCVYVVNSQSKYSNDDIAERIKTMTEIFKVAIKPVAGKWAIDCQLPSGCNAALYLVDDSSLPMSIVSVESAWGVVNVAKLDSAKQFRVEFARVFVMAFGASLSQYKSSLMVPVTKPEDLDRIVTDRPPFDCSVAVFKNLESLGVTKTIVTTYKRACEEGWAAAPTNKYQKAIWDKVHAMPKNPMKIEFDPVKGR